MSKRVTFESKSGKAEGEIVEPAGSGKAPGVVLLQEWWGVNDHIRSILDRLAQAGFIAMAPDLFHGKTTKSADEAGKLMGALDWTKAIGEIDGAAKYVLAHPRSNGKVAVMGFCMGGALSYASGCAVPEFSGVVSFYGMPGPDKADYGKLKAPVLAHVGAKDGWVTPDAAKQLKSKLEGMGKSMELHVYDADHAFVNDTRPEVYNPTEAKVAWDRSMKFLHAQLG